MIEFCKTKVASDMLEQMEPIKNDDEEVRKAMKAHPDLT